MHLLTNLEKQSKPFWVTVGLVLTGLIGMIDAKTGHEIVFSPFYLISISLVTWFAGRWSGILISIASAIVWLVADIAAGHTYSFPAIYYWNTTMRLVPFLIITVLLSKLKSQMEHEKELARTDPLTRAANTRSFFELTQMEIDRAFRYKHPFTLAYIDLDNFKAVNDRLGHSTGDKLLCGVIDCIKRHLRKIDVVARLGGDEFALLLPETGQAAAQVIISKIQHKLLDEMQKNNWPVTFSIGVLTCTEVPSTMGELIKMADDLMYSVKNNGKNAIRCSVYAG